MRISRVYTRGGDKGKTSLVGGQRVMKDAVRVEAYGTVDELSAHLGVVRAEGQRAEAFAASPEGQLFDKQLEYLQHQLFDMGASLSTPQDARNEYIPNIEEQAVTYLESLIDAYNDQLPPLKEFVLPAGNPLSSALHVARCVARRAERRVITLDQQEPCASAEVAYLNRLSDLLFVWTRWANRICKVEEHMWTRNLQPPPASIEA